MLTWHDAAMAAVGVAAGFDDLIDFVDLSASFRYRATRDGLGWFLEGNYVRLDGTRDGPADATLELTTTLGDVGFSKERLRRLSAAFHRLRRDFVYDVEQSGVAFGFGVSF